MKALTIQQPWASAIVAGIKTVENRPWPTSYTGKLLIHAGKTMWPYGIPGEIVRDYLQPQLPFDRLPFGTIIGAVDMVDCQSYGPHLAGWDASGPWCWMFENAEQFEHPFPCRGKQGLWYLSDEVVREMLFMAVKTFHDERKIK